MGEYFTIKLGRDNNEKNHIKIKDSTVSKEHLAISWIGNGRILIRDLDSTNGTYVNGMQIVSKEITPSDMVRIGASYRKGSELINKCKEIWFQDRVDFSSEFREILPEIDEYKKKLKKLNFRFQSLPQIVRGGIVLIAFLTFILFGEAWGIPAEYRLLLGVASGIIAGIVTTMLFDKAKFQNKVRELKALYADRIACPKCGTPIDDHMLEQVDQLIKCRRCDASWK